MSHITITDENKKLLLNCFDDDLAFLISKDSLLNLKYLHEIEPNCLMGEQIAQCVIEQEFKNTFLDEQSLFIYKVPKSDLSKHQHTSRVSLSLAQLRAGATVLLFDKDKEILKEQHMIEHLEAIPDQSQLLETPNLIIIPSSVTTTQIVMSQSYIFESLCFMKDFNWLNAQKPVGTNIRLSHLPVILAYLPESKLTNIVAKKIVLDQLTLAYGNNGFDFAGVTIASILQDEKSICLRDLPAYYACATSLLYKLKTAQSKSGTVQKSLYSEFDQMSLQILEDSVSTISKLTIPLNNKVALLSTSEEDKSIAAIASVAVERIDKAIAVISKLHTLETIQAMYVLPLETARQTNLTELAAQEVQSYTEFYNYHIRDSDETELLVKDKVDTYD